MDSFDKFSTNAIILLWKIYKTGNVTYTVLTYILMMIQFNFLVLIFVREEKESWEKEKSNK